MRNRVLQGISTLMLFVFSVCLMPKELLHDALTHHHDDVHHVLKKGEVLFTGKHHHCTFLTFEFTPYIAASSPFIAFEVLHVPTVVYCNRYASFSYTLHRTSCLRGPPAFFS